MKLSLPTTAKWLTSTLHVLDNVVARVCDSIDCLASCTYHMTNMLYIAKVYSCESISCEVHICGVCATSVCIISACNIYMRAKAVRNCGICHAVWYVVCSLLAPLGKPHPHPSMYMIYIWVRIERHNAHAHTNVACVVRLQQLSKLVSNSYGVLSSSSTAKSFTCHFLQDFLLEHSLGCQSPSCTLFPYSPSSIPLRLQNCFLLTDWPLEARQLAIGSLGLLLAGNINEDAQCLVLGSWSRCTRHVTTV